MTELNPELEAKWLAEVERRLERIESGEDQTVPWEEIRGRLRDKFSS